MDTTPPETGNAARGEGSRRFGGLPDSLLRYLEARGVLLTVEAQEAAQHLLQAVVCGTIGAIFAFSGWVVLMCALVNFLNETKGWSWVQVGMSVGLGNLALALIFVIAAARRLSSTRWFELTMREFGKDRTWLAKLNDKP